MITSSDIQEYLEYNPDGDYNGFRGPSIADKFYKRNLPKKGETLTFIEKHRKILEEIAVSHSQ